ncbi:MAG: hypothetical protein LCI00_22930 [Chloroflexi bacterium]|nr:hypothetical protein [Chloroflexota bacterium]MCC6895909.1 hypothetical protein [Anaerolineae bacterium]
MKMSLRHPISAVLLLAGLLAGCTGNPDENAVLPTLAVLPSLTPENTVTLEPTFTQDPSELATKAPEDTNVDALETPNAIVLPSPLEAVGTPTPDESFSFTSFPSTLSVGDEYTLEGVFTTDDVDSENAALTNDSGQTVNLLVDPFTAMMGNNQRVQITGIVEAQPGGEENAIRVSAINLLDSQPEATEASDLPPDMLPAVTAETP